MQKIARSIPTKIVGPTRQQRAIETRKKLIKSARVVFARDGFEQASLEEIASHAGKSRGAFYDNFKNKEDIFFAIFEEDLQDEKETIRAELRKSSTRDGRLQLLVESIAPTLSNRESTLLQIEFKTYAIRSQKHQKRLADLHAAIRTRYTMPELEEVMPELAALSEEHRRETSLMITGVLDGMAIANLFDPGTLSREHIERNIRASLDQLIAFACADQARDPSPTQKKK